MPLKSKQMLIQGGCLPRKLQQKPRPFQGHDWFCRWLFSRGMFSVDNPTWAHSGHLQSSWWRCDQVFIVWSCLPRLGRKASQPAVRLPVWRMVQRDEPSVLLGSWARKQERKGDEEGSIIQRCHESELDFGSWARQQQEQAWIRSKQVPLVSITSWFQDRKLQRES